MDRALIFDSPAAASQNAGITGVQHHDQLCFIGAYVPFLLFLHPHPELHVISHPVLRVYTLSALAPQLKQGAHVILQEAGLPVPAEEERGKLKRMQRERGRDPLRLRFSAGI